MRCIINRHIDSFGLTAFHQESPSFTLISKRHEILRAPDRLVVTNPYICPDLEDAFNSTLDKLHGQSQQFGRNAFAELFMAQELGAISIANNLRGEIETIKSFDDIATYR